MCEREHFYQCDSTCPAINQQRIVTPGKNGMPVTQSLSLQVLRPLFQIASLRFGSLSVHCGCYNETSSTNAPYPMTAEVESNELHLLTVL